jgi:LuxR family maltose regulon positive regulatory protein
VLDRLCGPLCDALLYGTEAPAQDTAPAPDSAPRPPAEPTGQETLEYLEQSNLFIVPLDGERRWYRYHHLFADLLRQRARQRAGQAGGNTGGHAGAKSGGERGGASAATATALPGGSLEELHRRASRWYEGQGYAVEAFRHAAAAGDVQRAIRLITGEGMPLQFRGAVAPVLGWLESLPRRVLDAHPSLWVTYASTLSMSGRTAEVEDALRAAEAQLPEVEEARDAEQRNLIGHIAAIRALLAAVSYRVEEIISQSDRALQYLHPGNLAVRTATTWKLGIAYQLRGELETAARFYEEAVATGRRTGNTVIQMAAALGLAGVQEEELRLHRADETYREVLELAGELPMLTSSEACLGLARIRYQWNDTEGAEEYGRRARHLARTVEGSRWILPYELFMARLACAGGDLEGAEGALGRAEELIRRREVEDRAVELAGERLRLLLLQGRLDAAERLAEEQKLPLGRARVALARGDCAAALEALTPMLRQAEEGMPMARRIRLWLLHALALAACGEEERALERLREALARGEAEGCLRIFLDEGEPLRRLLSAATARPGMEEFTARLLSAFRAEEVRQTASAPQGGESRAQPLIEPLSSRELEILQLIDRGYSNHQIAEQLFLALSTVKGHNRNIFEKLAVRRRTEAVARARELDLL